MHVSKFPLILLSVVRPSVWALAQRLFILTENRPGSAKQRPTVGTFHETGIVLSFYEHLLMTPELWSQEIRYEHSFSANGGVGAPKRVDLWIRPKKGGYPHFIEVGDFSVTKVHADMKKMIEENPMGKNWFVALFRKGDVGSRNEDGYKSHSDAKAIMEKSLGRGNGLDTGLVGYDGRLTAQFEVYRPNGAHDWFGVAILQAIGGAS